jgi:hypothetical protein
MEQKYDLAVEEIKEAKNPVEKEMLLQKYGMIEPKLTPAEKVLIAFEETCHEATERLEVASKLLAEATE